VIIRQLFCTVDRDPPRAAVAIERSLQLQSPENGNIRRIGRRLSAVRPPKTAEGESGDYPRVRKSPLLAGFSAIPSDPLLNGALDGWGGRDRTSEWRKRVREYRARADDHAPSLLFEKIFKWPQMWPRGSKRAPDLREIRPKYLIYLVGAPGLEPGTR